MLFLCFASVGVGLSFINIETNKNQYSGFVVQAKENYFIFSTGLEKFYIKNVNNNYEVGDILNISGYKYELEFATLESGFDFKDYLKNKGVKSGFDVKRYEIIFKVPLRLNKYKQRFLNKFDSETKDFIGSIYFGSGYANSLSNDLKSLHLFRLSTLSGLAILSIWKLLTYFIGLKVDDKKAKFYSFCFLCPYLIFVMGKFAIFKLVFLYIFSLINAKFFSSKLDYVERLSIFGIICLIFNKYNAYQLSFNLSFLMSILFLFYNNSFVFLKPKQKKFYSLIFIFLFFIPFESQLHHEISILGPIFQVVLSPFLIFISLVTMLCFYGIPLYGFSNLLVKGLNIVVNFIKPSFFSFYCPPMPMWFGLIFEVILLIFAYLFSIRFKPLYKLGYVFASLIGLYFVPIRPYIDTFISFINIGQGDSTLIHIKGLDILVDTGGSLYKDIACETLIPYFKKKQIYAIDYLITTHDDFDHMGARDSLMKNFKVKNYLREPEDFPLKVGDFTMNNLNVYCHDSKNENDNSLVLQFSLGSKDFLIMGDAPIFIENYILNDYPNLHCDILKVGHHGSNTSSCYRFIKTLQPDTAIISCGLNNKYGHPHDEVISILNFFDVEIRRTDVESTITYYF